MNQLTTEQRDEIIRDVEQIRIETDYEIKKAISERLYNFINSLVSEDEMICPCDDMPIGGVLIRLTEKGYSQATNEEITKRVIEEGRIESKRSKAYWHFKFVLDWLDKESDEVP